jgi:hypothetical protein
MTIGVCIVVSASTTQEGLRGINGRSNSMKPLCWVDHSLKSLIDREIDRHEAELTITSPEFTEPDPPNREIRMRRYFDPILQQTLLLRVVVEEKPTDVVVITVYKTSQIARYLRRLN